MGYRSDVVIYIKETDKIKEKYGSLEEIVESAESVEEFVKYSSTKKNIPLTDNDIYEIGHDKDGTRILKCTFEWVKWYDGYDFIKFWNEIMNYMISQDEEDSFLFTRLGEESGDFESEGDLGYSYPITDFSTDIDYRNKYDDASKKIYEMRVELKNSGLGEIITSSILYSDTEEKPIVTKTREGYKQYLDIAK